MQTRLCRRVCVCVHHICHKHSLLHAEARAHDRTPVARRSGDFLIRLVGSFTRACIDGITGITGSSSSSSSGTTSRSEWHRDGSLFAIERRATANTDHSPTAHCRRDQRRRPATAQTTTTTTTSSTSTSPTHAAAAAAAMTVKLFRRGTARCIGLMCAALTILLTLYYVSVGQPQVGGSVDQTAAAQQRR